MQKFLAVLLVLSFAPYVPLPECAARASNLPATAEFAAPAKILAPAKIGVSYQGAAEIAPLHLLSLQDPQNQNASFQLFSPEQLDNLLAPIALYPDPLLAQVLLAATFPDQIDQADREAHANYDQYNVDSAPWDVSVKAVARYPAVLHMMADKLDWTTSLGQAYVSQSSDVMAAVQQLRAQARSAGNLVTTPQMEVIQNGGYISLWPAQPRYIYVPVYDPAAVFFPRRGFFAGAGIGFGSGFVIGAWLNHDFDWGGHRVFYHGWNGDGGWVGRSRPYVQINNVYVNRTYVNVNFNRTIVNRNVNYGSLNRYNAVHRDVRYDNVRVRSGPGGVPGRPGDRFPGGGDRRDQGRDNRGAYNKIIDRNINTRDPRLDVYRGRAPITPTPQRGEDVRPDRNRTIPNQPPRTGPAYQPSPRGTERPNPSVYGGSRGPIDPGAASRRGQNSRVEMNRPSSPPPSRGGGAVRQGGSRGGGRPSGGGKPGGRPR